MNISPTPPPIIASSYGPVHDAILQSREHDGENIALPNQNAASNAKLKSRYRL